MNSIKSIENYIIHLITNYNLSITLHPMQKETLIIFSDLKYFNIHDSSYCTCFKESSAGRKRCRMQQKKVFGKISETGVGFSGCCHAGVFEYVYPLFNGQGIIGFISVSGYLGNKTPEQLASIAEEFGLCSEKLQNAYHSLRKKRPDENELDTLIFPLCQMLELAYIKEKSTLSDESLTTQMLRYIQQNYEKNITSQKLCEKFNCSRSYFSHIFKKKTGKTFKEYLTEVRLNHAKRLLLLSNMNITEISFSVGFNDSNYFSDIFKKYEGCSPMAYKKVNRQLR